MLRFIQNYLILSEIIYNRNNNNVLPRSSNNAERKNY